MGVLTGDCKLVLSSGRLFVQLVSWLLIGSYFSGEDYADRTVGN